MAIYKAFNQEKPAINTSLSMLILLLSLSSCADQHLLVCNNSETVIDLTGKTCGNFIPPQVSCRLPADIEGELRQANMNNRQRATDLFAWQTFIALNWPAETGARGTPDPSLPITAQSPRVWETWKETNEVYLPDGAQPTPWNNPTPTPPSECTSKMGTKVLYRQLKVSDGFEDVIQPTLAGKIIPGQITGSLSGQNGELVRYEMRYNKVAFDYVVKNGYYSSRKQAVTGEISFPPGSMIIKASWLPLTQTDVNIKNRFYTINACVCDPPAQPGGGLKGCKNQETALVGLHIMEKTTSAPQWIWSTFEQINNVKSTAAVPASFNNPSCDDQLRCPENKQLAPGISNQVTRVIAIPDTPPDCAASHLFVDNVAKLNEDIQRALAQANSAFQNYQLVNAQWPLTQQNSQDHPPTVFSVIPKQLGNTTMETFIQPTSSCMGCHAMARTARMDQFVSANFSFTLSNAQPTRHNPLSLSLPTDHTAEQTIKKGYQLATQTYELLPQNVGGKLHCASCHLVAGSDPNASWWVNMQSAYSSILVNGSERLNYPQSLQHRINGCFSRSMNGRKLCTPGDGPSGCDNNPNMQALIAYMESLTAQWKQLIAGNSTRGFPQLPRITGNPSHGKEVFAQKCAFCHQADGQGRYANDTYYRPALWGPNSFNDCAGMAKTHNLSAFIKSNMPLGSGGVLTDQESWDLATFIDDQCRPGKQNCAMPSPDCKDGKDISGTLPPVGFE